jgi:cystathionine beta-lyase
MAQTKDFDFDAVIDRTHTHCEKYDGRQQKFGRADVIPLWVADMDFAAPPCVREALVERAAHPVYGYTFPGDSLLENLLGWYQRRHHWQINPDQLLLTSGVMPSLFAAVNALTEPGDSILVPTPVYPPFFAAVETNHRRLVQSPLPYTEGGYRLDFDHLEQEARNGARMLLLCSPHNPVGRVWRECELKQLIDLALHHQLIIISDEIHCDLAYPGHTHIPLASLAPTELRWLTAISPSKTFNMPGLNLSALVVSHDADRKAVKDVLARSHVNPFNPFTLAAFEAAYGQGDAWLDALRGYLDGNRRFILQELACMRGIVAQSPEATCLVWLDCRQLGMNDWQLRDFFIRKAGLGLNEGNSFGLGGAGFMRLNIGTRRALLAQAMTSLAANLS